MDENATKITQLLQDAQAGNRSALDELLPLVYQELKRIAGKQLSFERKNHTLQATALVHEAYMVLVNQHSVDFNNRLHFFSIASEAMRRILVNHAVAKQRQKRGDGATLLSLDDVLSFPHKQDVDLILLDEALNRLTEMDEKQAKIVEMKFFGGMTNEEIAQVLDVSESTVKREWASARAWLLTQIQN
ncbi:MAG: sigma-70 family RNA polymerase sigma factor [Pyrinomonadaceae bacterium]|jgi:RNA polymerase sigma factor (TIGR02999 family)|nr:sigma-70 family RNA polymerase sigma factor [Pyrinomonadaceae bacterium]